MITITMVIPTFNRSDLLKNLLMTLKKQTISQDEFEILVVDNGSTDGTMSVAESFFSEFRNIRYFFEEKPGLHEGRHRGLREAVSDILVYCDDDIEPIPTWLEAIQNSFKDPEVVLVGGKNLPKWENDPPKWIVKKYEKGESHGKCLSYLSVLDFGDEIMEIDPLYVWGCNFSIRKQTLIEAGGFHPDSMPEDLIMYRGDGETHVSRWIKEKGMKAIYNPKASVYHFVPEYRMTLNYFKKRAFNQGISDSFTFVREKILNGETYQTNKKQRLRSMLNKLRALFTPRNINKIIHKSYHEGKLKHFFEYQRDLKLRDWVNKKDWIN